MNTELRTNAENEFEKDFFKLMNKLAFGKTSENQRNHRYIKLVTSDKRRKRLVWKPNYHSHKKISEHLMAIEMKKTKVKMTKPRYLGMSILDISKTLMYEFWYDYIKPKCGDRAKLCYTDTDSFVIHIITEDFFEDISGDVERWFDTSNYVECNSVENDKRPLPIGKNKKVPGLFKDELGGKIIAEVVALRPKTWAYLMGDGSEKKKAKGTKKCVIKRRVMFENYKNSLFNEKTIFNKQQRFKSYHHDAYKEEINKIALSSNNNNRIQTFDKVTTFPQETPAVKVCENEMLSVLKAKKTLKILSKECENELYVTCNIFLNYVKTKCSREIKQYVEINLKKYVKKYEKIKAQAAFNV